MLLRWILASLAFCRKYFLFCSTEFKQAQFKIAFTFCLVDQFASKSIS